MRRVDAQTAHAIAVAQYPRFLDLRERAGKFTDPKLPREQWIANRAAEIMRLGASPGELSLIEEKRDEKSTACRAVLNSIRGVFQR